MYFGSRGKIERADMDGLARRVIVSNVSWPSGIALDRRSEYKRLLKIPGVMLSWNAFSYQIKNIEKNSSRIDTYRTGHDATMSFAKGQ